jgi:hypothetical protein
MKLYDPPGVHAPLCARHILTAGSTSIPTMLERVLEDIIKKRMANGEGNGSKWRKDWEASGLTESTLDGTRLRSCVHKVMMLPQDQVRICICGQIYCAKMQKIGTDIKAT